MRWTARPIKAWVRRGVIRAGLTSGAVVFLAGCQLMTNPFVDDYANAPPINTASVSAVRAANKRPTLLQRGFESAVVEPADGTVTHSPLLFEDGFADTWTEDDTFAWTAEDWIQWLTWRARFGINMASVGFSWITTPPWSVMASDGYPSRCLLGEHYDAALR